MAENKHKHLDFIQSIVNRMAANSFVIKGWTVTLVSALFAFAASKESEGRVILLLITLLPIVAFWVLDGYFLWQERLFRSIYNEVSRKPESEIDFQMNPTPFQGGRNTWLNATFSQTLNVFYGILLLMVVVIGAFVAYIS